MPHVLVIEDDIDSAEPLAELISAKGFTVATATTLRDARRQMALQVPDLILLDLVLPDGNGLELLETTRDMPHTEVVLITGHASLETSIQALRRGGGRLPGQAPEFQAAANGVGTCGQAVLGSRQVA